MYHHQLPDIKEFLDEKVIQFNTPSFIETDPVSIPHLFSKKEDIEISAFLTATLAWGQRSTILKNASRLMMLMDFAPHDFILNAKTAERKAFQSFVHRTFNGTDCLFFLKSLTQIYKQHGSMGAFFENNINEHGIAGCIHLFKKEFFKIPHPHRTTKHIGDPFKNSACKRINMFLRWMVRKDKAGIDFGIWNIDTALLMCPLDVHSGRVARKLGLLERRQDDWKAVEELTKNLRMLSANDPIQYDFALFGIGASKEQSILSY
jgi:uncharacterized protein (TIGR02757 family)